MKSPRFNDEVPMARSLLGLDAESVFAAVARYYDVAPGIFACRGSGHVARASAAWLARRLTQATLRELAISLGLGRPESVSNLTCRIDSIWAKAPQLRNDLQQIESQLRQETKNKV